MCSNDEEFSFFHKWDKWKIAKSFDVLKYGKTIGQMDVQQKVCQRCGLVKYHETKIAHE